MRKRDLERLLSGTASTGNIRNLDLDELSDEFDAPDQVRIGRRSRDQVDSHARGRLTEEARKRLVEERRTDADEETDDERPSTWPDAEARGPQPWPEWVVTELSAVDRDLGVLKSGKEAEVYLLERGLPGPAIDPMPGTATDPPTGPATDPAADPATDPAADPATGLATGPAPDVAPDAGAGDAPDRSVLLAVKRYRAADHRNFHRDAGYLEGRRVRASREMRAMERRSAFGRNLIAQRWALAEFDVLSTLWEAGAPVPYPVQRIGTELMMEFIGDEDGIAAPRLAELQPEPGELAELWRQLVEALEIVGQMGWTHGDLSAYNILVHRGEIVLIDLPQVVDIVANPQGREYVRRDVSNVARWFASRGLSPEIADADALLETVCAAAGRG